MNKSDTPIAIEEENILVKVSPKNDLEIIDTLATLLYKNGYVKQSYSKAVQEREKVFPTGLQTTTIGFAIPHADSSHVLRTTVAVATLKKPVKFRAMDNPEVQYSVKIVMMLAIKDPDAVVTVLQKVVSLLKDEPILKRIKYARTAGTIKRALDHHIEHFVDELL